MPKGAEGHFFSLLLEGETPLHFSLYRQQSLSPTPLHLLKAAKQTAAGEGIRHVYLGNVM